MILGRSHHQLPEVHHPFGRWVAFNLLSEVRCIYHGSEKKHGGQDGWGDEFFVFDWSLGEKTMRNFKELTSGFWNDWISGGFDSEDDTVDGSEIRLTSWYGKCPFYFFNRVLYTSKRCLFGKVSIILWLCTDRYSSECIFMFRKSLVGSEKFRPRRSQKLSRGYLLIS